MRKDSKILTDIGGFRLSVRRPAAGRRLPACALVLCIASFLLAVSCQRKEILMPEYNAVVTILDGSSTRAIPEDSAPQINDPQINDLQINDIAIFAFSEDELVGYIYESGLAASGKTIFPMTLTKGGSIDFYVIANSEPGFFKVVDQNDKVVDWSSTSTVKHPINVTPADLEDYKVKLGDDRTAADRWYAPMTNLPGAGRENMRFDVDGMTRIPIDLTRAVSKVEVWFRTLGDTEPEDQTTETGWIRDENPSSDSYPPGTMTLSEYYSIDKLSLIIPVESVGMYGDVVGHTAEDNSWQENAQGPFDYIHSNSGQIFPPYETDPLPSNFYSDEYFVHIWTCYIFPNTFGGNMAGESPDPDQVDKSTLLSVEYSRWQQNGQYVEKNRTYIQRWIQEGWFGGHNEFNHTFYWEWGSTGDPIQQGQTKKVKDIYLPPIERNTSVRVWCPLGDDTDRSFTYTVVDWDETVTVNVPDFN